MSFRHVLAGQEFTEANFEGTAYANEATGFPRAMEKIVEHVANAFSSPSSTSMSVGSGPKAFTVDPLRPLAVGQPVRIAAASDPAGVYMDGSITAYAELTGAITVEVASSSGSGTYNSWMVSVGGLTQLTVDQPGPLPLGEGGTGATSAAGARTNLGLGSLAVVNSPVAVASGGTGATTAATARTSLGLGSLAVESSPLQLNKGGTGATSASAARANLGLGNAATENVVPIGKGGTGATAASTARTNLGLGSTAIENVIPVAKGGTGATTIAQARANLGLSVGPKRPQRTTDVVSGNSTTGTVINTTGSGWVHAVYLRMSGEAINRGVTLHFVVDGITAPTITFLMQDFSHELNGSRYEAYSGFIPYSLRFETSLQLTTTNGNFGSPINYTTLIWSLD